jgi:ABC-type transport system substrate-binding protein
LVICDSIRRVEFSDSGEIEWTITYLPGVQDPTYYLMPFAPYPSHLVLSDRRKLVDVPAEEWVTLPEITETPLSYGPFHITEWIKGRSITMEANPYYEGGTGVQTVIVVFISDTNQAAAQLLSGDVDYLDKSTLGGGAEVQTLLDAAEEGRVNIEVIPSPTWEHIDMNMFVE